VLSLIPMVVGLALFDSINPSAIGMTIHLMLSRSRHLTRTFAYLAGVFCTYLTVGVLILLGLDVLFSRFEEYWYSSPAYAAEGVLGALMLLYCFVAPKEKPTRATMGEETRGHVQLVLLGAGISVVEFSTALPYLGAIAIISRSDLGVVEWLPLMVLYNLVMVLPPVALVVAYSSTRGRLWERLEGRRTRLSKGARSTWLWILGILGILLLLDSLAYFDFLGLVDVPERPIKGFVAGRASSTSGAATV